MEAIPRRRISFLTTITPTTPSPEQPPGAGVDLGLIAVRLPNAGRRTDPIWRSLHALKHARKEACESWKTEQLAIQTRAKRVSPNSQRWIRALGAPISQPRRASPARPKSSGRSRRLKRPISTHQLRPATCRFKTRVQNQLGPKASDTTSDDQESHKYSVLRKEMSIAYPTCTD